MKRSKYSVAIQATVFGESGEYLGEIEIGSKDSVTLEGEHLEAFADLYRLLKKANDDWFGKEAANGDQ